MKPKLPAEPQERRETIRQAIIAALDSADLSAKDISQEVGISEKDVYEHLEHIRKTLKGGLKVHPATCMKCGFVFRKRDRLKKPGKCPVCSGESISLPLFGRKR